MATENDQHQDDMPAPDYSSDNHKERLRTRLMVWLLAAAVLMSGILQISPLVGRLIRNEHLVWISTGSWREAIDLIGLIQLPRAVISLTLILMAFGLLTQARIAWVLTLLMLVPAILLALYESGGVFTLETTYDAILVFVLLWNTRKFARSSVAAGTLFALASLATLVWCTVLGSLYLGEGFKPVISTLNDAIYFSFVTLTTVGYGDITPVSETARYFVIVVIVIGITIFSTALGAVILPLVTGRLSRIIKRKVRLSMKENHIILCGGSPVAVSLYHSLKASGKEVTVILPAGTVHSYPANTDILYGDGFSEETLHNAGVMRADYVIAAREKDADNAFQVLAVKAIPNCTVKTVAVNNDTENVETMRRTKPDMLFSPQLFGAEVLSRLLQGQSFDPSLLSKLFTGQTLAEVGDTFKGFATQGATSSSGQNDDQSTPDAGGSDDKAAAASDTDKKTQ